MKKVCETALHVAAFRAILSPPRGAEHKHANMNTVKLCPLTKAAISLGIRSQDANDITTAFNTVLKMLSFDGINTDSYVTTNLLEMKIVMANFARNFSTIAP